MSIKKNPGEIVFDIFNVGLMILIIMLTLYPFLHVLFSSLSDTYRLMGHRGLLFAPLGFNLFAYENVFNNPFIMSGFKNTLFLVTVGTFMNIVMMSIGAYFLSRKKVLFKMPVMVMVVITMYFGGGLIPSYLLVKSLHIPGLLVLIIPGMISTFDVIVLRTGFMQVPESLTESAFIDGAGHFSILFKVVIPLSKPVIAVIVLWSAVGYWNEWFSAGLFIREKSMYPIQLVLKEMLDKRSAGHLSSILDDDTRVIPETIQSAATIVSIVPILFVYPFLQKYFTKGVMIGALKE